MIGRYLPIDRQARLSSFEEDLGMTGSQFNVAVSILNVGYMLMQLPSYVDHTPSSLSYVQG